MGKVYGLHVLQLKSGANIEEFEQSIKDRLANLRIPGMHVHLLRADRGSDVGRYGWLMEIDSVEARDRLFPVEGTTDQVAPEVAEQFGPVMDEFSDWLEPGPDTCTDWVAIV